MEIPNEDTEKDKDKKPEVTSSGSSTSPQEDKFEVRINSYQLADIFGKIAVHNEVAFYRNGEPFIAFNGNAHNKETGELNTFAIRPNHTLKVSAGTTYEQQGMKLVGSVSFGTLTREEFAEKLKATTQAANFINDNKVDYVIVGGPHYGAQNSNSVATTLLQSMDYKYPEKEFGHLWAPGSKRPLLPDDWSSQDMTQDDFIRLLEKLERDEVSNNIKNDKNLIPIHDPEISNFPDLFKPNETSVPYNKSNPQNNQGNEVDLKTAMTPSSNSLIVQGAGVLASAALISAGLSLANIVPVDPQSGIAASPTTAENISNPQIQAQTLQGPSTTPSFMVSGISTPKMGMT